MVVLEKFRERIEVASKPIGKKGYKMDGINEANLRHFVGLKGCHCCDYFIADGKSVLLIEETQLMETMNNHKTKYNYLDDNDKDDIADKLVEEENILKVYASMLILCRLATKCKEFEDVANGKKYEFWLVVSDAQSTNTIALEALQKRLRELLRSALGKSMISEIKVFSSDMLEGKITQYESVS